MNERRWTNPSHPQTLQIAVFLLYFRAVFLLLFSGFGFGLGFLGFLFLFGFAYGGFGIANDQRSGYQVALGTAIAVVVLPLLQGIGVFDLLRFDPIGLLFDLALIGLLVHPMSRDYQKIWFS